MMAEGRAVSGLTIGGSRFQLGKELCRDSGRFSRGRSVAAETIAILAKYRWLGRHQR